MSGTIKAPSLVSQLETAKKQKAMLYFYSVG